MRKSLLLLIVLFSTSIFASDCEYHKPYWSSWEEHRVERVLEKIMKEKGYIQVDNVTGHGDKNFSLFISIDHFDNDYRNYDIEIDFRKIEYKWVNLVGHEFWQGRNKHFFKNNGETSFGIFKTGIKKLTKEIVQDLPNCDEVI